MKGFIRKTEFHHFFKTDVVGDSWTCQMQKPSRVNPVEVAGSDGEADSNLNSIRRLPSFLSFFLNWHSNNSIYGISLHSHDSCCPRVASGISRWTN